MVAFNWYSENHYAPHWAEYWVTATVVLIEIWALRWVVNRMPVLGDPPAWAAEMDDH